MPSIQQFCDYLKIATMMEKDVYSSNLLISKLESKISTLNSTNYYTQDNFTADSLKEVAYYKQKRKLPNGLIIFIILCSISCIIPIFMVIYDSFENQTAPRELFYFLISFSFWAIVIAVILIIKNKKANKQRNINIYLNKHKFEQSNNLKVINDKLLLNYNKQLEDVKKARNVALQNLNQLYNENILPSKYRNFAAVATMYQWLTDGRCTEIYGHGGLFDTYEYELKFDNIVNRLDIINEKLELVISNQNLLYDEVRKGNEIAEKTYQSVCRIENTADKIASDISSIKTNSSIVAMNSAYMSSMEQYRHYRSLYY